jgi:toxin ParE1/3/4
MKLPIIFHWIIQQQLKNLVREGFQTGGPFSSPSKSGKLVEEFEASVYREIVLPPCRIFYRVADNIVYIIHVIREEQLIHIDILKSR